MNGVVLSPKAKADLSEIWDYTYSEWGIEQAEKYTRGQVYTFHKF